MSECPVIEAGTMTDAISQLIGNYNRD